MTNSKFLISVLCCLVLVTLGSKADQNTTISPAVDAVREKPGISISVSACNGGVAELVICNNGLMNESWESGPFYLFGVTKQFPDTYSVGVVEYNSATSTSFSLVGGTTAATSTPFVTRSLSSLEAATPKNIVATSIEGSSFDNATIAPFSCEIIVLDGSSDKSFRCGDTLAVQGATKGDSDIVELVDLPE